MAIKDKIFKAAKGFRGRAKSCVKIARNRVEKAWQYQYRDRRNKKRDWRALWITRINAATREHGVRYNEFIHALAAENVCVDRKILAELAVNEPKSFKALVDRVRYMRGMD
jgi:large subunit ribosomal protein L20